MPLSLTSGSRLGPYEILSPIGAGGMGEVYRAHDARLGRDVAIKVMPPGLVDADRQSRFEQEARAAAALNHPNIVAVYDVGQHDGQTYIVSELLVGQVLSEKLRDGALPLRQVIDYATQIARGLAAAHARGIVHRDLKPANVFITADGHAKILDFGLAKLAAAPPSSGEVSPTLAATAPIGTAPGLVFGTVGYMAPEQVRALAVDHRADIFAFGVLLYEMATGTRAFSRETPPETMTAILKDDVPEPPLSSRQVPVTLTRIIRRCVEKEPAARFQSALDLAFAIEAMDTSSSGSVVAVAPPAPRTSREWIGWAVAAAAIIVAIGLPMLKRPATASPPPLIRLSATLPDGWSTNPRAMLRARPISIAPDGKKVAVLAARTGGRPSIWIRDFDRVEMHEVPGTDGAANTMIWSPDSSTLVFNTGDALKRITLDGGQATTLCTCAVIGGLWKGDQLFLGINSKVIQRMPAAGGALVPVTHLEGTESLHAVPVPVDDDYFLFGSLDAAGRHMNLARYDGRDQRRLNAAVDSNSFYYAAGYVVHEQGTTVVAQRLNVATATLEGPPITLLERIYVPEIDAGRWPVLNVRGDVLAYQTGPAENLHELIWVDRAGRQLSAIPGQGVYSNLELSPDGQKVALAVTDPSTKTRDIWTMDVARPVLSRFTLDPTEERSMAWSPDGKTIIFGSGANRLFELFKKSASGIGAITTVLKDGKSKDPNQVSPDGRWLVYRVTGEDGSNDLWLAPLQDGGKPRPLITGRFDENYGRISPDGKWMAYVSDESGHREIYVVSFPDPGTRIRISTSGGDFPRWRGDGRELYFMTPDNMVMATGISEKGAELIVGATDTLFRATIPSQPGHAYAPSPDGKRFLIIHDTTPAPPPVTVLLNWQQLLTVK